MKRYILWCCFLLLLLPALAGCARHRGPQSYVRPDFDFSFVKKVVILPFDNLTKEKSAGEHLRRVVINELLASGLTDVVVSGDAGAAVKAAGAESTTTLLPDQINKIGKMFNAQAVLTGSVERYEEPKGGSFAAPEVACSLIMYDTDSGSIIWAVSSSMGGASFLTRHFGARCDTLSEACERVIRGSVKTLGK
ncbi:MAG: hypothetical protein V1736_09575 [Pseudomonadota bacterium]